MGLWRESEENGAWSFLWCHLHVLYLPLWRRRPWFSAPFPRLRLERSDGKATNRREAAAGRASQPAGRHLPAGPARGQSGQRKNTWVFAVFVWSAHLPTRLAPENACCASRELATFFCFTSGNAIPFRLRSLHLWGNLLVFLFSVSISKCLG